MTTPMSEAELLAKLREKNGMKSHAPFALGTNEALALLRQYRDAHRREAFALGFGASGEGYNGEYPTETFERDPEWIGMRDRQLALPTTEPEHGRDWGVAASPEYQRGWDDAMRAMNKAFEPPKVLKALQERPDD